MSLPPYEWNPQSQVRDDLIAGLQKQVRYFGINQSVAGK